jgi:hypothetical protein
MCPHGSTLLGYKCPNPDRYSHDVKEDGTVVFNKMYLRHLDEYEKTQLQTFFLEEMQRVCPEWVKWYKLGKLRAGLQDAVLNLGSPKVPCWGDDWLDAIESKGASRSMLEMRRQIKRLLDNPGASWSDSDSDSE